MYRKQLCRFIRTPPGMELGWKVKLLLRSQVYAWVAEQVASLHTALIPWIWAFYLEPLLFQIWAHRTSRIISTLMLPFSTILLLYIQCHKSWGDNSLPVKTEGLPKMPEATISTGWGTLGALGQFQHPIWIFFLFSIIVYQTCCVFVEEVLQKETKKKRVWMIDKRTWQENVS